jgi:hypothetical protein
MLVLRQVTDWAVRMAPEARAVVLSEWILQLGSRGTPSARAAA